MDPLIHGYVHKSWHPNNHLGETLTPVYKRKKTEMSEKEKNSYFSFDKRIQIE